MSRPRRIALAAGSLAVLVAVAVARPGAAGGKLDSPEARLKARIADLHAGVALLEVESAASRENLLESLKKLGKFELGDERSALQQIYGEVVQMITMMNMDGPEKFLEKIGRRVEKLGDKEVQQQFKLVSDRVLGVDGGGRVQGLLFELELKTRVGDARAESDRMKSDFLKRARALHEKKRELTEAEAEYRATR